MDRKVAGMLYASVIFFLLIFLSPYVSVEGKRNDAGASGLRLWYKAPAKEWTEALPVGNGRLGGMVFGGVEKEHIQFVLQNATNLQEAANILDIDPATLWRKRKRYNL